MAEKSKAETISDLCTQYSDAVQAREFINDGSATTATVAVSSAESNDAWADVPITFADAMTVLDRTIDRLHGELRKLGVEVE